MLGINLQIFSDTTPQANLSNIQALWWDITEPKAAAKPIGKSDVVTTDSNGYINLDISKVSGLTAGDYGFLTLYQLNETDAEDSLVFSGKVQTSDISSGVDMYYYDSGWVRPTEWLDMDEPTNEVQKIQGLVAIYDMETAGNAVAVKVSGAHDIDWGDGTSDLNVASGTTTTHTYNYDDSNFDETNIVGKTDTKNVTFTASTDTVNLNAHGYQDGQLINFKSITTTTGIDVYTRYYVVNSTANTFQISATIEGTAITLTNDGSGIMFVPLYKIAVVTITPYTGNNLTDFDCNETPTNMNANNKEPWLELRINGEYLTAIDVDGLALMEQCWIGEHAVTTMSRMFYNCYSLQSVPLLDTQAVTTMYQMFYSCYSLQSVPLFDTQAVTTMSRMFYNCYSLQSVPLFDTQAVTTMQQMFSYCYSLQSVPLFDTQAVTTMYQMFYNCRSLQSVPLFDTQAVTTMYQMFYNCYSLQSVPLFDTQAVTTMYQMFSYCYSLRRGAMAGTSVDIDYSSCNLGSEALNEIYPNLATGVTATINVTGNWGTGSDDPSLAPDGWTVTG